WWKTRRERPTRPVGINRTRDQNHPAAMAGPFDHERVKRRRLGGGVLNSVWWDQIQEPPRRRLRRNLHPGVLPKSRGHKRGTGAVGGKRGQWRFAKLLFVSGESEEIVGRGTHRADKLRGQYSVAIAIQEPIVCFCIDVRA